MSHDFSGGASNRRARRPAGACHALRASRPIWPSPSGPIRPGSEAVSLKPVSRQHGFPLGALKQGMLRTQVAIGETPPAAGQAEDGFRPQLRRRHVHEDEAAAGASRSCRCASVSAHVAHRVKHVGADDEIERAQLEVLLGAGFFEIEDFVFHFGEGRELLHARRGRKPRRRR